MCSILILIYYYCIHILMVTLPLIWFFFVLLKRKHIGIFYFHITFNAFVGLVFVYIFQFIHFEEYRYYSLNFSSFTKMPTLKARP